MRPLKSFYKSIEKLKSQQLINILGFGGIALFLLLLILIGVANKKYYDTLIDSFFSYTAIILTFLGAVYWGFSLSKKNDATSKLALIFSIIPAILGWATNTFVQSIVLKIFLFLAIYNSIFILEKKYSNEIKIPAHYIKLRQNLNILVSIIFFFLFIIVIN